MICRLWRARATPQGANEYRRHFSERVVPHLGNIDGYAGAYLLERTEEAHVEIRVATLWRSVDAVRRFAGADIEAAVVEPEAQAVLTDYDTTVRHYAITAGTLTGGPGR
jgi:heme-degrading monooxygenase HmoA